MKILLALCFLALPALATAPNPNLPPPAPSVGQPKTPPIVINPNQQKTDGDFSVCNGNPDGQHPLGNGSTGQARIKSVVGTNGMVPSKETKTEVGFRGGIWWVNAGNKTVVIGNNNFAVIEGPGGHGGMLQTVVTVGGNSHVIVHNTTPPGTGAMSIKVTYNGGHNLVPPGQTAVIFTN